MKIARIHIGIGALAAVALLVSPLTPAQAADPCIPDAVALSAEQIHPGELVSTSLNGFFPTVVCTATDPGWFLYGYVHPGELMTSAQGLAFLADNAWGYSLTYESIVEQIRALGYTDAIEDGSGYQINFYRGGTADVQPDTLTPTLSYSIVLKAAPLILISPAPKAAKKITITCMKGKTSKKVTAIKPVCPKGYKKK